MLTNPKMSPTSEGLSTMSVSGSLRILISLYGRHASPRCALRTRFKRASMFSFSLRLCAGLRICLRASATLARRTLASAAAMRISAASPFCKGVQSGTCQRPNFVNNEALQPTGTGSPSAAMAPTKRSGRSVFRARCPRAREGACLTKTPGPLATAAAPPPLNAQLAIQPNPRI